MAQLCLQLDESESVNDRVRRHCSISAYIFKIGEIHDLLL